MKQLPKKYRNLLKTLGVYQIFGGVIGFFSLILVLIINEVLSQPDLVTLSIGLMLFIFSLVCGIQLLFFNSNLLLTKINQWIQVFGVWAGPFVFKYAGGLNVSFRIFLDDMTVNASAELPSITFSYFGEHVGFSIDVTALYIIYIATRLSEDIKEYKLLRDYSDQI